MNLVRKFVTHYISTHMDHFYRDDRNAIFEAINVGISNAFIDDNLSTRISFTVGELVANDPEFVESRGKNGYEACTVGIACACEVDLVSKRLLSYKI